MSSYELDLTFLLFTKYGGKKKNTPQAQQLTEVELPRAQVLGKKKNAPKPHTQAKKNNSPQAQLPQAQVLGELVMEPHNKALQEENGRLKAEIGILKEREICKQELMDEYKARAKNVEEENQRSKEENQQLKEKVSSLKEKEAAMKVEIEYLKRRDEELRRREEDLRRREEGLHSDRPMSSLMNGMEDRKRKRNGDDDAE
jgi:type IV secretory pathway VirB10-like protein